MRGRVPGLRSPHPFGQHLPALYQEDDLALRFVAAFDDGLAPVLSTLDNLAAHVDPRTCPEDWVDWLAQWLAVGCAAPASLPQRRARVAGAAAEHAASGTVAGIRSALSAALGVEVEVEDSGATQWSSVPGGRLPGSADMVLRVRPRGGGFSVDQVTAAVADLVPAHVRVEIELDADGSQP